MKKDLLGQKQLRMFAHQLEMVQTVERFEF